MSDPQDLMQQIASAGARIRRLVGVGVAVTALAVTVATVAYRTPNPG